VFILLDFLSTARPPVWAIFFLTKAEGILSLTSYKNEFVHN